MHESSGEAEVNWRAEAACKDADPDIFFPIETNKMTPEARQYCGSCTVSAACLDYALTHRQERGIWGGTTEEDRRRIIRRRSSEAAGIGR